jgi:hypothetical protein
MVIKKKYKRRVVADIRVFGEHPSSWKRNRTDQA